MAPSRNPIAQAGGLIDRTPPALASPSTARRFTGHPGDTLASALLANGVRLVGRSFKYHRPRGILTAGSEEPNALVELRSGARREPNTRATTIELYDGLDAASQNRWPSLQFDLLAVNQLFAPIFGAGFYYKTFMWPASFWEKLYEPAIRRAAGLGRARGRRRTPIITRRPTRSATCWSSAAGRAGSGGGARGGAGRRAGDPVRGGFPPRRARCSPSVARSTARPALDWVDGRQGRTRKPARLPHPAAHHGGRRLRRRAPMPRSSGSTIMSPVPPAA